MISAARSPLRFLLFQLLLVLSTFRVGHATSTYEGREEGAKWRAAALARIEKMRKSEISIEVVDKSGKPLQSAEVKLFMLRHSFGFGSAVTAFDLTYQNGDAEHYRQTVEKNFNKVVLENDLKWGPWDASKDNMNSFYRIKNTDKALEWLNQRQIPVRGHYAVWAHLEGDSGTLKRATLAAQEFENAVLMHAEEKIKYLGSRVTEWDVLNHPLGWGKETMSDRFGSAFYNVIFDKVGKWNPRVKKLINEGAVLTRNGYNRGKYYELAKSLLDAGAKVDGIGFMGHFRADRDLAPPEELLATFDQFAQLGLPLQVTEFDVRFGKEMGKLFPLNPQQEALQADYMRDFLIAAYSHPAVEGVVMWGFWEGRHWYPDAALYRKDWSIKPNGKVWEDLVLNKWWTNAAGTTDKAGRFSTRGFLGKYKIEVTFKGKKKVLENIELVKSGTKLKIVAN